MRSRPRTTLVLFCLTAIVLIGAMGWVTWSAVDFERTEAQSAIQAENERLALWRMESLLVPFVMQENARPHAEYFPLYSVDNAITKSAKPVKKGDVKLPSSLLGNDSPYVNLYFQFDPDGNLNSPQCLADVEKNPENVRRIVQAKNRDFENRLKSLGKEIDRKKLRGLWSSAKVLANNAATPQIPDQAALPEPANPDSGQQYQTSSDPPEQPSPPPNANEQIEQNANRASYPFRDTARQQALSQRGASTREYNRRTRTKWSPFNGNKLPQSLPSEVSTDTMRGFWHSGDLMLVRRTVAQGREFLEGCVLDWKKIRSELLTEVKDLLPAAELKAATQEEPGDRPLLLASLPVQLVPGDAVQPVLPAITPLRISLIIAWGAVLFAIVAVGVLLAGAVRLSERRGSFVSAVTHELRTPLTTLRMYSEMLAEGMVAREDQQDQYLQTLRLESDRLGHMVENVLSHSRLERNRRPVAIEEFALEELLGRLKEPLTELASRSGLELIFDPDPTSQTEFPNVRADRSAVERILFNLVDNAGKYAAEADPARLEISCSTKGRLVEVRIRDHGPGIPREEEKRIFRPFFKSVREAARTAPGVGLGLSLCRRLAREMRGDLCIDRGTGAGTCFLLTLPLS